MLNHFVETDGLARTVLIILFLTSIGCFTYSWGYYEGINDKKMQAVYAQQHDSSKVNDSTKHVLGHGLLSFTQLQQLSAHGDYDVYLSEKGDKRRMMTRKSTSYYGKALSWYDKLFRGQRAGLPGKEDLRGHTTRAR
ncbi:hypothetical protein CEUSTIGMA_g2530.t1 [Chlamydomonas eustigma]|uniref:Uncharacterized protein n=1 Tax=Chlamydomonas eustigma TaxID=1157962 RepID=A0A250WWE8_9CHLO|nr:hypothetical protein CEUSTIGMA_g2530.t1 [Chlamydomonas eustigma]|eukprot:GAX75086.1 hypothetical protein CEUSTIGMA_g2530.t1 [Chlamydomonas eustigma]